MQFRDVSKEFKIEIKEVFSAIVLGIEKMALILQEILVACVEADF